MWGAIAGFFAKFLGGLAADKAVEALESILQTVDKKITDDTQREKIKADVTEKFIQAQVDIATTRKEAFGKWAWVMAALFLPGPVLWWNMVFVDSTWPMMFPGYDVLGLPPEFYPWMTVIVSAVFFIPIMGKKFFGDK